VRTASRTPCPPALTRACSAGYACASYRRSSNFIRVPTTLIGLIDASVSIKVGLNWRKLKNRLGAYHAPIATFLDFTFLRTLPEAQVRNGFAELVKIAAVAEKRTWDLLVQHGPALVASRFGRADGAAPELKGVADEICWRGIERMLEVRAPVFSHRCPPLPPTRSSSRRTCTSSGSTA
jgi:3-dehydroquinate synthase